MAIQIIASDDELIITNIIKPKIDSVVSNGTGLKNLNNRFMLLVNREIKIDKKPEGFSVHLPMIRVKK